VEDDKSRQEEWSKLVEKNWKLREAIELLLAADASGIGRVGDAGAAAAGPHDPVHGDAREDEWIGSDEHASFSPIVLGSQRQHGGSAASECVDGGVVRAVPRSNIADGFASARIRV
jgi:hypothetical protein